MMIHRFYLRSVLSFIMVFGLLGCESQYQKIEREELASGEINNELFLSLELGMEKRDFFETCWQLNKEGILTNGPTELSVEYSLELPSGKPAKMRFYPDFENDKIYLMPVEFVYDGWAPWNEELSVEKLREDVIAHFEKWYGPGFFEVSNEDKSLIAFVKIDGNRRVRIFKKSLSVVRAEIVDLNILKNLEKSPS
ncbi:hypothetical protein [Algoriphagus limi]|uniref:Lipoprotein n=1 Tax=Algoriphagus limi TaxID=2975273 RepID=A0ABT2G8B8_9BACT|nr:hypothetical protein [Algoriphagus limi]MCS5491520.1 hypothetical protein [Algoriphagus limi]